MSKKSTNITRISRESLRKYEELKNLLQKMRKVLVAFSGGVDSTFLLKVAHDLLGDEVLAVVASSEIYPQKERKEALKLAGELGVRCRVVETHQLENPDFSQNPPQRCYFCKKELFSELNTIARSQGIPYVLDGSNYEDIRDFRPGLEAVDELGGRSPLKEVGLVKEEIRLLSRKLGLPTWNKPSFACLSSRFPYYSEIDSPSLRRVERAENYLRKLGFSQFRVRHHGQTARIEIMPSEFTKLMQEATRKRIVRNFKKWGYVYVTLDLEGYRSGSMNEPLLPDKKKI